MSLYEAGYVTLSRANTEARQVAFLVSVRLSLASLAAFFKERWEEEVDRPSSRAEQSRLERRLKTFCEENYCGRTDDWTVSLHRLDTPE